MGWRNFWRNTWSIIVIIFQTIWFVNIIIFLIVPRFLIGPIRRQHMKNKIKRKMMKLGVPRKEANIYAKSYRNMLYQYSSIGGLSKLAKNAKELSDLNISKKKSDDSLSNRNVLQPYNNIAYS